VACCTSPLIFPEGYFIGLLTAPRTVADLLPRPTNHPPRPRGGTVEEILIQSPAAPGSDGAGACATP
jgi:hypothetical protein